MSANDNFSLHDDEELSLHDDASLNGSVPASNKGDAPAKPPQIITTNTLSNIKLPVLQKDDYDTWAMEMEHYLEYIDNEVWKVIQNGNSKKRVTKGKDGVYRVLPPTTQEEQFADEKERKARTLLLMAVPKDHLRRFHGMDDAKEIWAAIKTRFGGNANSKKMQKAVLKQQFEAFTISSKESLEKGYDRFQKLLSQLDALGAGVSDEEQNHKFLEHIFVPASDNVAFLSQAKASSSKHKTSQSTGSYSSYATPSSKASKTATPGLADDSSYILFIATNADDRTVECFQLPLHGHFSRECKFKGLKEGSRQEAGKGQNFKPVQLEKEALMTIDEGQINWVEQTYPMRTLNHAIMAFSVNNRKFSHWIKNCDYFEKKIAREAALKEQKGMVHANVRKATPAGIHPLKHMEHRGIFDSGCSGHMTGNRAHLEDYQELSKVGSVTFGGSKGSISGKAGCSLKSRSIDKGRRYKRRKETKGKKVVSSLDFQEDNTGAEKINTADSTAGEKRRKLLPYEETPKKTKEQIYKKS
ncbi:hypothetical protein Tco_0679982 [Tanacetum coccineum]|uniref:Uncharacterized protein n=1 Tax=Tanacetum coccineum TaxID=301880 RepID=A0ABQ4XKE9_9ASTR